MPPVFKKIAKHTLSRYIFIGGASFAIEACAIFLFIHAAHFSSVLSVALSFWVGLIISFILQKFFAFRDKKVTVKHVAKQSIAYAILITINYLFTLGFVVVFETITGVFIARTLALIITTIWNFIVYSKIIFKDNN